jgi:hypothetical protein
MNILLFSTCNDITDSTFIRSASAVKHKPKPAAATPAPKPSALEAPMPTEPVPEADVMLPDLQPPKPQQAEAGAGGEEQVEAPDAAPADGSGKCLTAHG